MEARLFDLCTKCTGNPLACVFLAGSRGGWVAHIILDLPYDTRFVLQVQEKCSVCMQPSPDAFLRTPIKMGDVVECSGFLGVATVLACSQTTHWIFSGRRTKDATQQEAHIPLEFLLFSLHGGLSNEEAYGLESSGHIVENLMTSGGKFAADGIFTSTSRRIVSRCTGALYISLPITLYNCPSRRHSSARDRGVGLRCIADVSTGV